MPHKTEKVIPSTKVDNRSWRQSFAVYYLEKSLHEKKFYRALLHFLDNPDSGVLQKTLLKNNFYQSLTLKKFTEIKDIDLRRFVRRALNHLQAHFIEQLLDEIGTNEALIYRRLECIESFRKTNKRFLKN